MKGFTLIELLVVVGISIVVLAVGGLSLLNYRSRQDLRLAKQHIVSVLRDAQENSVTGEDGYTWGVRFTGGARGTAALISLGGGYATTTATTTLKNTLEFRDPAAGTIKDVFFDRLSGYPLEGATVIIKLGIVQDDAASSTITIYPNGRFEY